jgi:hypothetical protein
MKRDGNSWVNPKTISNTVGRNNTSVTVEYSSDSQFQRVVGIDSWYKFRVRTETEHRTGSWVYGGGKVYTDPVRPKDPFITRPDGDTITVHWENNSDIATKSVVFYRKDTGEGYGSWNYVGSTVPYTSKGDVQSQTFSVENNSWMERDARYQFKIRHENANDPRARTKTPFVYADYGNKNNVFFETSFESGDTSDISNWLRDESINDSDSGVYSGDELGGDSGISGADDGTYYLHLESGDHIGPYLSDLRNETNVVVRASIAAGSMDNLSEEVGVEWYDGSSWKEIRKIGPAYNKQGWVHVNEVIPDSWLADNNKVRFISYGGSGDYLEADHLIVSDLLHEYTTPSSPSASMSGEYRNFTTDYTIANPFTNQQDNELIWRKDNGSTNKKLGITGGSTTVYDLLDGQKYFSTVRALIEQDRRGTGRNSIFFTDSPEKSGGTYTVDVDNPSVDSGAPSVDVSWDNVSNNEDSFTVSVGVSGIGYVNNTVSANSESATVNISDDYLGEEIEVFVKTSFPNGTTTSYSDYFNWYDRSGQAYTTGVTELSRTTKKPRQSTVYTSGESATERMTKKPRNNSLYTSSEVSTTRNGISKSRSGSVFTTGSIETIRTVDLVATPSSYSGSAKSSVIRSGLNYTRKSESSTQTFTSFTYNDRTSLELLDYDIEWSESEAVWYTPWFSETKVVGDEDQLAVKTETTPDAADETASIVLQYDETGTGVPDKEGETIHVTNGTDVHEINHLDALTEGQYRFKITNYGGYNSLTQIALAIVH